MPLSPVEPERPSELPSGSLDQLVLSRIELNYFSMKESSYTMYDTSCDLNIQISAYPYLREIHQSQRVEANQVDLVIRPSHQMSVQASWEVVETSWG